MHCLGLLGGMSWESTALYYRLINEGVRDRLGGLSSAELVLYSVDFARIEAYQRSGDWRAAAKDLGACARGLVAAGAEAIVLCTNTMHAVAEEIEQRAGRPLIHIADATAAALHHRGCQQPLLLGTAYTMEQGFYRDRLRQRHNLAVRVPPTEARETVQRTIYDELCQGIARPEAKTAFLAIVDWARRNQGIDGVILGCTEIGLLLEQADLDLPVLDSAERHAEAAVAFALQDRRP